MLTGMTTSWWQSLCAFDILPVCDRDLASFGFALKFQLRSQASGAMRAQIVHAATG